MRPKFLLQNGCTQLLQSFFDRLPDHQTDIERGSTYLTQMEMEVDHSSKVLQTGLVNVTSNSALMLDFSCGIKGIPTIDLTKDEPVVCYPPQKGQHCWWPWGQPWGAHNSTWSFKLPSNCSWWDIQECSSSPHRLWCGSRHISCFSLEDYSYSLAGHRQAAVLSSVHW